MLGLQKRYKKVTAFVLTRSRQALRFHLAPFRNRALLLRQKWRFQTMDQSYINQNFELDKSRQKFHHSLKEHHKISNIPKFRCEKL
jgi:hypothetical protein